MGQGRLHKKEVFNLKHKGIIYSPPQASWAVNEMWPSPCSLGSIRLRFTKLLFISRFTKDQAYLHHGTQNSLLCDTGLGHTLHSGVTKSQFSLLKVPSLLHLLLTAGGKGQPFPPVLHLMENLTKCSERKKKKKKGEKAQLFFLFLLSVSRKHLVPTEALDALGQYPAILNNPPKSSGRPRPWGAEQPKSCDFTD